MKVQKNISKGKKDMKGRLGKLEKQFQQTKNFVKENKAKLLESEQKFKLVFENAQDALVWVDAGTGIVIESNRAAELLFERPEKEIKGQHQKALYPSEEFKKVEALFQKQALDNQPVFELAIITSTKKIKNVLISASIVNIRTKNIIQIVFRDITLRKRDEINLNKSEEELKKSNRTLKAITGSNQAMMRAHNEQELLDNICKIIVKNCGHYMVWIGYAEHDEVKTVRPVAHCGPDNEYLKNVNITWAGTERGRGPMGESIRTKKPSIIRDTMTNPHFKPWREQALKRGYKAVIGIPLINNNIIYGKPSVYIQKSRYAFQE